MTSESTHRPSSLAYTGVTTHDAEYTSRLARPSLPADESAAVSIFGDDDDFADNFSEDGELLTVGGDDLGVYSLEPESDPAPTAVKAVKSIPSEKPKVQHLLRDVTKNDKVMFRAIRDLGPLTGKHLAEALNKDYATKKQRITLQERGGLLDSKLVFGIKMYNNTRLALTRIDCDDEAPASFPERLKYRHNLMVATQVLTLRNNWEKKGMHPILPTGHTLKALPVVCEKLIQEQVEERRDAKYGDDLYLPKWRKECNYILQDSTYPVVDSPAEEWGSLSDYNIGLLDYYWRHAGAGRAAAALSHWDDNFEFGNTRRSRAGKDNNDNGTRHFRHRRRPDAVIAQPHLRVDGENVGMSIAVEVETTRKDIPEYVNIIRQWMDHPLMGGLFYIADKPEIVSALKSAWKRIVAAEAEKAQAGMSDAEKAEASKDKAEGMPTMLNGFKFEILPPRYLNLHLDDDGYFG